MKAAARIKKLEAAVIQRAVKFCEVWTSSRGVPSDVVRAANFLNESVERLESTRAAFDSNRPAGSAPPALQEKE